MKTNYINLYIRNISGLICREYASSLLNLSSFPNTYITIESDTVPFEFENKIISVTKVDKLDLNFCYEIKDSLYITNEERTIVDLIRNDCEGKLIDQSLERYLLDNDNNIEKLIECSKHYKIENELKKLINEGRFNL